MEDKLIEIKQQAHEQLLDARRVEYILKSDRFETAWVVSSLEQRKDLADNMCLAYLEGWLDTVSGTDLSYDKVRQLAKTLHIYNYSRLPVDVLRETIKRRLI